MSLKDNFLIKQQYNIEQKIKDNNFKTVQMGMKQITQYIWQYCYKQKQEQLLSQAINQGFNVNIKDHEDNNLCIYMKNHKDACIFILLKHGIIINNQNKEGNTALHICYKDPLFFQSLIEAGASPFIKNNESKTSYALIKEDIVKAQENNQEKTITQLKQSLQLIEKKYNDIVNNI